MQRFVFYLADGSPFYVGSALVVAAMLLPHRPAKWISTVRRLFALTGLILIGLSATPLPLWASASWFAVIVAWLGVSSDGLASRPTANERLRRWQWSLAALALGATIAALIWEARYFVTPSCGSRRFTRIGVIGDSISAGMLGPWERIWPRQFETMTGIAVDSQAEAGATAKSALRQAERLSSEEMLVVVEIGGNDLLSGTPSAQFAVDLERLLRALDRPQRQLVLLELPLPPFYNGYGRAQRELARKHHALLIPKRRFASVLAAQDATLDGLHLSESGHRRMAEMMRSQLGNCLAQPNPERTP